VGNTTLLVVAVAGLWLIFASRYSRQAVWFLLLWVPIQGWVQLNVFNDSSATVLLYEFQIIGIYAVFAVRAVRSPESFGPPSLLRFAVPFILWTLLLIPHSVSANGLILTLLGLRTYLLPLPLVWIGYRAFETRRHLEHVAWLLMLQLVPIAAVTTSQFAGLTSMSGAFLSELPRGYDYAAWVIRPPGTFSSPGHLGMYVLFAIPLALGLLGLRVPFSKRTGFVVGLVSATVALVANTQRATIVLLAVTLPLIAIVARRQAFMRLAVAFSIILAGGMIGSQVAGEAFRQRVESISRDFDQIVVRNPLDRMADALRMPAPTLGGGLGIASPGARRLEAQPSMGAVDPETVRETIKPAESFMAALVYQTGVVGLALFYLFIAALISASFRAVRACRHTDVGLLAAAIFSYQVAILIQSWAYDPLHYPPSRVFFWVWTGVLLNLPKFATPAVVPNRLLRRSPVVATRFAKPLAVPTAAASRQRP
jgi:hypothetical protein